MVTEIQVPLLMARFLYIVEVLFPNRCMIILSYNRTARSNSLKPIENPGFVDEVEWPITVNVQAAEILIYCDQKSSCQMSD